MVKDDVVAKQDVSYVGAVGASGYTNLAAAVTTQGKNAANTLELLADDLVLAASVELNSAAQAFVVDYANGSFANGTTVAVANLPGYELTTNIADTVYTYVLVAASTPEAVDPGSNFTAQDYADGVAPVAVVTEEVEGVDTQLFVVKFRSTAADVTYTLMTTDDLTLTEDQWKGLGTGAATPVDFEAASAVSASAGELITLKAPMDDPVAFFKIRASFGGSPSSGD